MERIKYWLQRMAEGADLPGEPIPGMPVVELFGTSRVLIEHHKGITGYGSEQISVKVSFGKVQISGHDLQIIKMTADQLVIGGVIHGVTLVRREENGD